jgi:hypothetical protein
MCDVIVVSVQLIILNPTLELCSIGSVLRNGREPRKAWKRLHSEQLWICAVGQIKDNYVGGEYGTCGLQERRIQGVQVWMLT